MGSLAIEINEAGLVLAGGGEILLVEPAYAMLSDGSIVTGEQARAHARLRPRQVSCRYWSNLSLDSGTAGLDGVASAAELALAQLETLWRRFQSQAEDVIFVVPAHYRREQLGVLLGIAQECAIRVRALVDSAAAASSRPYPGQQLLYLDAGLHRVSITRLQQSEQDVASQAGSELADIGLAGLNDHWARRLAELFVLGSRFDPLHRAETEQLLYEQLPIWLALLQESESAEAELSFAGEQFRVELRREQILNVAQGFYRALVQLVSQTREPDSQLVLQVSERLASLPGLCAELLRLDEADVIPLPRGQAALGALAGVELLGEYSGPVRLLKRLPWREGAAAPRAAAASPSEVLRPEAGRPAATHVVHRGIAYPVGSKGLVVGRQEQGEAGGSGIVLDAAHTGVSREHCEIRLRDGELRLIDKSRFGTFVNERRIAGETVLAPADVIRIGSPGEQLTVVALRDEHGT